MFGYADFQFTPFNMTNAKHLFYKQLSNSLSFVETFLFRNHKIASSYFAFVKTTDNFKTAVIVNYA